MTRVLYTRWSGATSREMDLDLALTPDRSDRDGQVECAAEDAQTALEAIGRLLAALVQKRILTLEEARVVSGNYGEIEELPS